MSAAHGSQLEILGKEFPSSTDLESNGKMEKDKSQYPWFTSLLVSLSVFLLFTGYFIWATIYYFKEDDRPYLDDTTCTGYGFLLILYIFILYGVIYYYMIKPFLGEPFIKHVYNPLVGVINKIKYFDQGFSAIFFLAIAIYLGLDTDDNRDRLIPISGLLVFLLIGFLLSTNRSKIPWHTVLWGLKLQFIFGLLTIRWSVGRNIFDCVGSKVNTFLGYALDGAEFVYGNVLVRGNDTFKINAAFAFSSITAIFFLAFCINILYYYEIMQKVVGAIGEFLQWVMDTTICESVNCAANIFLGQSEAPLLLKPYLMNLTDSEIHSIMTSGFATVSGSVLAAYIGFGADPAALITASVMSAPAALCFSKLMYPEEEEVIVTKETVSAVTNEYESVLDAATQGIQTAFEIVSGIVSSLIAFIAFMAFVNGVLGWFGSLVGYTEADGPVWSLDVIMGKIFIPISYVMGVPWDDCEKVGTLIGTKTMINEFVAYQKMQEMAITGRSKLIATYALCGFANPGSLGIMISAMSSLIPNKKQSILKVIYRAFVGGSLVCFMTACIASMLSRDEILIY